VRRSVKARRSVRPPQPREFAATVEALPAAVVSRARRRPVPATRETWTRPKLIGIALTGIAIVVVAYLAYLAGLNNFRSDLNRVNSDVNQRVQAQSVEITRLQSKSADLEAKLAAATTDLGIVRTKIQLQRATLRAYQARAHLASGDESQALKDLNDANQALDAAGAIASSDTKSQITAAQQSLLAADGAIRGRSGAVPAMEKLGDQLALLTAE
jgi:hypothetical protein